MEDSDRALGSSTRMAGMNYSRIVLGRLETCKHDSQFGRRARGRTLSAGGLRSGPDSARARRRPPRSR